MFNMLSFHFYNLLSYLRFKKDKEMFKEAEEDSKKGYEEFDTTNMFDISLPIHEIKKINDYILIDAKGTYNNQKIGIVFKFVNNIKNFLKPFINEDGELDYQENPGASIKNKGANIILEGNEGLNFANLLMKLTNQAPLKQQKENIVFDCILLLGDLNKLNFIKYFNNGIIKINEYYEKTDYVTLENSGNILKFKLINHLNNKSINEYQLLLVIDIIDGNIIFSEKNTGMRKYLRGLLNK